MTFREAIVPIREALRPARQERRLVLGLLVGTFLYAGAESGRVLLVLPLLRAFTGTDLLPLRDAGLWLAGFAVALGLGAYLAESSRRALQDRLVVALRLRALRNLLGLSIGYHAGSRLGEITNRLTSDIEYTRAVLRVVLSDFLQMPIRVLSLGAIAVWQAPRLAPLLCLALPMMAWPVWRYGRRIRDFEQQSLAAEADLTQAFQQALTGVRQVKAFAAEDEERARFAAEAAAYRRRKGAVIMAEARNTGLTELTYGLTASVLLGIVGLVLWAGWVPLGQLVVFGAIVVSLYHPARAITKGMVLLQESIAGLDRVLELTRPGPTVPEAADATPLPRFAREIAFDRVGFTHADGTCVLQDCSLTIGRGETVVVTGESGAGKSTLLDLMARLHDPQQGAIRVDGADLRAVTRASLCASLGVVAQEPFLFHDSIAANIRYGRLEATDAEVEAAARVADIHDEISALPEGYATVVGERGVRLSGGQRQRITIARAILRDAPILLLDEALAAIDAEGRVAVEAALERLRRGRTTLAVTHDLRGQLVETADRIVVLEGGRVVEQGPFAELAARDGPLRRLLRAAGRVAAGLVLVVGLSSAQEPVLPAPTAPPVSLRHEVTAGQVIGVDLIRRKVLRYEFAGAQDAPEGKVIAEVEQVAREAWTDRVVEAVAGRPTRLRRHYTVSATETFYLSTNQRSRVRGPLEGRTLRLSQGSGGVHATSDVGEPLPPATAAGLTLESGLLAFLPGGPVAPGSEWRLDEAQAARLLAGDPGDAPVKVGEATGRLVEVTGTGGAQVARLALRCVLTAALPEGAGVIEATLEGTAEVEIAARRLRRLDLAGPLTLGPPKGAPPGRVVATATGRMELRLLLTPDATWPD